MRHRSIKSRAGKVMLGAVLAGALSGAGANIARATLTLDLEPLVGSTQYTPNNPDTSVTVAPGTTSLSVEVYGVVTAGAGSSANDGLGGAFASFDAAGALSTGIGLSLLHPTFDYELGSAASDGSSYSVTDSNSVSHVGIGPTPTFTGSTPSFTSQSTTPSGWAFAAYLNNNGTTVSSIDTTDGTALTAGNGSFFNLGTLTLSLNATAATGTSTTLTGYGRTQQPGATMVAALWTENGVVTTPAAGTAIGMNSDEPNGLTVTVASTIVHNPGDVNDDGIVNQLDLNIVNSNWNKPAAGLTWEQGNLVGDATIDQNDLNAVNSNWNKTYSDYNPSIIVAPEPACLGMLAGIGLLGFKAVVKLDQDLLFDLPIFNLWFTVLIILRRKLLCISF